jgi:predicted nucleotidyltransferase
MSRLITSDNALRALLFLSQGARGMRTSEVAAALEISHTGARKALDILVADGLATSAAHRYAFDASIRTNEALRFALAFLPSDLTLTALGRGNEAVEFVGTDDRGTVVVVRRFSVPATEQRLRDAVETMRDVVPGSTVLFLDKSDLRGRLATDQALRQRATGMRVLVGAVQITFPDRTRHGDMDANSLGRLNPAITTPSARRLRALARQYGLRRILAFGSATRADFRPDSDIDLLVEPMAGRTLGLGERVGLMADAERLFGRDVDVLTAPVRRASLAHRIGRDGVVLYDATR